VALWLPALFTSGLGWSLPAPLLAEGELAARVDPWPGNGAGAALLLSIPLLPDAGPESGDLLAIELEAAGRSAAFPLPGGLPAELDVDAALLEIDPWQLARGGAPLRYRLLTPAGIALEGEACLRLLTARESLDRLEADANAAKDPLERGHALARAARAALDLGQPGIAEPSLATLGDLLLVIPPASAPAPAAGRAPLAFEHALLEARLLQSYDDADPRHRESAVARLERSARGGAASGALAAERAILLAGAAIERLPTARSEGERRETLDAVRDRAREARESARGTAIEPQAELLWARVAIERGWRTEARETLDRLERSEPSDPGDPRRAARIATLRARLAAIERDPAARDRELESAARALEQVRDHLGDPELDGGLLRLHREAILARIGGAAARGDARAALAAIEDARPRRRAPRAGAGHTSEPRLDIDRALAALPAGTTLLVLAEGEDALVTVRIAAPAGRAELAVHAAPAPPGETARRVATLLRSRGEDPVAAAWLAERLLVPHEGSLAPLLLLAPLGGLRPVPFDALPLGGRYLCESHEVATIPDLAALLRAAPIGTGPWLALADPATDYDGDGAPDRPALPSTRGETAPWAELGDEAILRVGAEARESSLRTEGSLARVLHLGCHGEHEPHRPMRSRLLLAPGEGEDGRISAAELAELDLGAAVLVTLSGCETGLTRALGGDDLAGFPRAVLESGAAAFLGSLWPVEDGTAGAFLRTFHSGFRECGDPGRALRAARLQALADPARRAPRHWAPWILLRNAGKRAEDER